MAGENSWLGHGPKRVTKALSALWWFSNLRFEVLVLLTRTVESLGFCRRGAVQRASS